MLCADDAGLLKLDDTLDGAADDLLAFAELGVSVDLELGPCGPPPRRHGVASAARQEQTAQRTRQGAQADAAGT